MENKNLNGKREFRTSQDYSKLSFFELLLELERACSDLASYRKEMVTECNAIRKETANGRHVDEVI